MRSGSTLQYQLAARLVEDAGLGKRIAWARPEEFPVIRQNNEDYRGWKVFKTHLCTDPMAEMFRRRDAVGIYIYRDVRDVIVSILRKMKIPFEWDFVRNYLNTCLVNYSLWTGLPDVMVSCYEEVMTDLAREVKRTADFLGIPIDSDQCTLISSEYSLERQRQRIEQQRLRLTEDQRSHIGPVYDTHSLLHINHISSGLIGQWENYLTPGQTALIEEYAADWLVSCGYTLRYVMSACPAGYINRGKT